MNTIVRKEERYFHDFLHLFISLCYDEKGLCIKVKKDFVLWNAVSYDIKCLMFLSQNEMRFEISMQNIYFFIFAFENWWGNSFETLKSNMHDE